MIDIPLSRGLYAKIDDDDYKKISNHKWYAAKQPNTFYAVREVKINGKKKTIWMHREINKTPKHMKTDHINGNGLDNRKINLRSVDHADNMINSHKWRTEKYSNYRGVTWHKTNKRWYAQITVDYKNIYLGSFLSEDDAKKAFDKARRKYRINKIYRKD